MGRRGVHSERHAVQRHMRRQIEEAIEDSVLSPTPAKLSFRDMLLLREKEFRTLERRHQIREDLASDHSPIHMGGSAVPHPLDEDTDPFVVAARFQAPPPVKPRGAGSTREPRSIYSQPGVSKTKWEPPKPRYNPRKGY